MWRVRMGADDTSFRVTRLTGTSGRWPAGNNVSPMWLRHDVPRQLTLHLHPWLVAGGWWRRTVGGECTNERAYTDLHSLSYTRPGDTPTLTAGVPLCQVWARTSFEMTARGVHKALLRLKRCLRAAQDPLQRPPAETTGPGEVARATLIGAESIVT